MPKTKDKKKPVEEEVAIEEVLTDDTVLSREDFLQQLRSQREPEVFEGCRVQGLSATDYQRRKMLCHAAVTSATGKNREEQFAISDCASWLALGVIEPKLDFKQWVFEMDKAHGGRIERLIQKIKELSGAIDLEAELVKKVLEQTQDDTTS